MDPLSGFVKGVLDLNEWNEIRVDERMATSKPGIYAAGDVVDAAPHQVATAAGTGVAAALAVGEYLSNY
jgi:thioredoxin reductase